MEYCCICKDEMIISVQITCMPCYHDHQMNCNSMTRICLWCVIHYLQLYLSPSERDFSKKCLYCSHRVRLSTLTIQNSFRIDFTMIRHQSRFNPVWECPFCYQYRAVPLELIRHIMDECNDYYFECSCGKTIIRHQIMEHRLECKLFEKCGLCVEYIQKSKRVQHMKTIHNSIQCQGCHHFIDFNIMTDHMRYRCPYREIQCILCQESMKEMCMERHLETHRQELEEKLVRLHQEQQECQRQLQDILQNLMFYTRRLLITNS